jgi:predicted dehydrogenase
MRPLIRAAIVGYGESGRLSHAYGLQANEVFKICAVCDLSEDNRKRAQSELGCPTYESIDDLWNEGPLDLVSIVTRSDTHTELACTCMERGAHVLITKPWALNAGEARRIIETAKRCHKQVFPWIPVYWAPDYRLAKKLIADGRLGDVFMIRRYLSDFRRRNDWQTLKRYGGGYLLNWGMHVLQPVLALAESPLKRLHADLCQFITPGDTEDHFSISMEFANGIRGVAEFTKSLVPLPSLLIQGTHGTLLGDGSSIRVVRESVDGSNPHTESFPLTGKAFGDEAEIYSDLAKTLLHGHPFPVSTDDALAGTIALDCARLSHEQQCSVAVPPAY